MSITVDQSIDLDVIQGLPFSFSIPAGTDPAGWTAELQVRDAPGGLVFADLSVDLGIVLDVDAQALDITFTADQTNLFALVCVWDVLVTPEDAPQVRLASGSIYLTPSVTR